MKLSDCARTKTGRFFLKKYGAATLNGAAEYAAIAERELCLPSYENYCEIPIKLEPILRRHSIDTISKNLSDESVDAFLLPKNDGYQLEMPKGGHLSRNRFTLAHEIGHSLFRNRRQHLVGVTGRKEYMAEDLICNLFASALLMPKADVNRLAQDMPNHTSPWKIFHYLEKMASKFQVSLSAMVCRLSTVKPDIREGLLIILLVFDINKSTGKDRRLRVRASASLGDISHMRTWPNRTAEGINLELEKKLFCCWQKQTEGRREETGGRFTLGQNGSIIRAKNTNLIWRKDDLPLSIEFRGKWRKEIIPMEVASCLYVAKGWTEKEAYIVSIAKRA